MRETKPPRLELATSRFARRMQWNAGRNSERRANPPKAPATTRARPLKSGRRRSRPLREGRTAREPIGEAAATSCRKGTSGLPNLASLSAEQAHRRRTQPKKHAAAQRSRPLKRGARTVGTRHTGGAPPQKSPFAARSFVRRRRPLSPQGSSLQESPFAAIEIRTRLVASRPSACNRPEAGKSVGVQQTGGFTRRTASQRAEAPLVIADAGSRQRPTVSGRPLRPYA